MTTGPQNACPPAADDIPPVAFLVPLGISLLLFSWPTLVGLAGVYRTDGNFSHGFLVPVISAFAAWRLRAQVRSGLSGCHPAGLLPLCGGILLILFARWYELSLLPRGVIAVFIAGIGLVAVLVGLTWLLAGWLGVRRLVFPLGFLLLGVPIPSFLLHRITIPLQQVAAVLSTAALRGIGVTVERQGSVLQFSNGLLGVDEACSGIRSLAVLVAVALTMIHFSRLSWRGALALLATVAPLAVLGNALRVFISGVFMALGWPQLTHGGPHELLGLMTFALGIGLLAACSSLLADRTLPVQELTSVASKSAPAGGVSQDFAVLANPAFGVAILFLAGAAVSYALDTHYDRLHTTAFARLSGRRPLAEFPRRVGAYVRIATHDLSEGEFSLLDPSEQSIGTYMGPDGRQFSVTVLYWAPPAGRPSRRPDLLKRPHSPDWCFPAAGWNRQRQFDGTCPADVFPGEQGRERVFEREGKTVVVLYWTGVTAARTGSLDQVWQRLLDMVHSWSSPPLANLHTVTISTAAEGDPSQAREAARSLARALAKVLPEYGVGARASVPAAVSAVPY